MGKLIDCKAKQEHIKGEIAKDVEYFINEFGIRPRLVIIQVGDNPASNKYINQKIKHGEDVGIEVRHVKLEEWALTCHVIGAIEHEQVLADGIIVQLPLPAHIDVQKVFAAIDPMKDVDCLTLTNQALLYTGRPYMQPCTPAGIIEAMGDYDWTGKKVLIVGRSEIVGKPLSLMLTQLNATVTLAHSKTKNLTLMMHSREYDVIVSAVGKAKHFTAFADVLIDVGINFDEQGKMCGDFDLESSWYNEATPVPNGVGRMTIIGLLRNTVKASRSIKCDCGEIVTYEGHITKCKCGTRHKLLNQHWSELHVQGVRINKK